MFQNDFNYVISTVEVTHTDKIMQKKYVSLLGALSLVASQKLTDVSEVLTTSLIRAMSRLHAKKQMDQGWDIQSSGNNGISGRPKPGQYGEKSCKYRRQSTPPYTGPAYPYF